jgi:hypothetical protein
VCVLVVSVLVRFLVCLLHSLVALLAGGPGTVVLLVLAVLVVDYWWSLSFFQRFPFVHLPRILAYHPCSFARLSPAKALQCCVLSQRFGVIYLSFHFHHGPSAVSLVVLLLLFLHLFVCLSGCLSARGRRAREPCAYSSSLLWPWVRSGQAAR